MLSRLGKFLRNYYTSSRVQIEYERAVRDYGKHWLTPQRKLKADIRKRLANEDYTCRMPKLKKPVVRHKLRLGVYEYGGYVASVWR